MKKSAIAIIGMLLLALLISACTKSGGGKGDIVKIRVEVFDRGTDGGKTDPTDNQWTKWIKEKVLKDENIDVEFVRVSRWDETSAMINLMAAGTAPDLAYTYAQANIQEWASKGGIFDMAPHIDTTVKDLNSFLGPDLALPGRRMIERQRDNQSGKIFSIPQRRMNTARINAFIRKDWLDKLGLPLPKTTQEFYDALVAFKEKDPGGVGRDKVIPFSLTGIRVDWDAANILYSFVDPNIPTRERWTNNISEREFLVPGYREGLRFMNKMYNAGLIDRDFPLYKDSQTIYNLLKSGVIGSFMQNWDQIYREGDAILTDLRKNVPDAELVPVDCFTSSDGLTHKASYDAAGIFAFIPAASKNPEAAMRYLNWLARYENYHFIQTGPEGIVHTIVDGVPKLNPAAGDGWIQNSAQNSDYTYPMQGLFLGSDEENIRALAGGYPWPADLIVNAYTMAMTNARPGIVISTSSPLLAEGPLNQSLIDKAVVIYSQTITCRPDQFDTVYDAQVKEWLAMGAEKVRAERIEKYVEP